MRRFLACAAACLLVSCGGGSGVTSDKPTDTTTGAESPTTVAASDPAVGDASVTYRMVTAFLSQTLAAAPGLRQNVDDVEALAACMVNAGYQINVLPPPGYASTQTTLVAPETMIAPMLTYLAETCTGIPSPEWAGE
jgi:hypothetical protein